MGNINIDLRMAGGNAESVVMQNIAHAGSGDIVTITVDRRKAHEVDALFDMLEHEGFDVQPKGDESTYNIIAHRKHN